MTWKEHAHKHIAKVLREHPDADEKTLRRLISAAYPWGERQYFPYKAWLQAVNEVFANHQADGLSTTYSTADYTDTPLFAEEKKR